MKHLIEKKLLPFVNKPGRYIGGESGQIVKPENNRFKIALGYPDMYEIGMSYMGLQILYNIINRDDRFLCERFFSMDMDAEEIMRRENIPFFSLESYRSLKQFDVVGFTLAYEMIYTNVLNILDMSGIPLRAKDRTYEHPLIIAGGPVAHNPEPTSAFFDLFYIGDAEDNIINLLEVLSENKHLSRMEKLEKAVLEVPSVYVPQFYDDKTGHTLNAAAPPKVKSSRVKALKREFYPDQPLIPFIETVHDRLTVEIMRGCPRGCRFCQASEIYKPVRTRSKYEIASQVDRQIKATGYDEVSLLSLSSSDYPDIIPLTVQLSRSLHNNKIALSLPSLRPGTFSRELADAVKFTRKTGLTFAPEAGTERLRTVIRKDITDQDLYDTLKLVFDSGWNLVKLYFMIGLPTENDEDIEGIVKMISRAVSISRNCRGKNIINITISPFSPKAHTPFQWDEQASPEVIRKKNGYIKRHAQNSLVNIKLRDPNLSFLEGIIGRGGRELCDVIETAFKAGARFDGWSEYFDFDLWINAFQDNNLNAHDYLQGKSFSAELPWSRIEMNRSVDYLEKERNRTSTMLKETRREIQSNNLPPVGDDNGDFGRSRKKVIRQSGASPIQSKIRIRWGRKGLMRYLSHLDNVRVIERAIRRAEIPIEYSQGFHPHMKMSFGPPLQLGYTSEAEYLDITLAQPFQSYMAESLKEAMPKGFFIVGAGTILGKKVSLSGKLNRAIYEVYTEKSSDYQSIIENILNKEQIEIERKRKSGIKVVDIRPAIYKLEYHEHENENIQAWIHMELGVGDAGYVRPTEVLSTSGLIPPEELPALQIHRKDLLYIDDDGNRLTPMEF